ncbi:integrase arm-type DNA-binding domain-containing protein [Thiomicrorhabdus sp. 6S2-11]|uniref:Integrase arm-type DNA-binding domain-containing protein n=1 Tax=Thiomicrorhabdus marina TaxID=2818442 RepID=A0ABS3Q2Y1_9GAMM|nr:integrase arm-type DNA-binding domain-containing protein [Thiomicrorhabdus marina]MBO1926641.1 integrase arm-type DNA-binding domain-containing protein [Thiomicrorhabdus marina]
MKRKLTDRRVLTLKPQDKQFKESDGGGLYLLVKPSGTKTWRYDFALFGNRYTLTIGQYPDITLKRARELHEQARGFIAEGLDPRVELKRLKGTQYKPFSAYALDLLKDAPIKDITRRKKLEVMQLHLFPVLDKTPVDKITTIQLYEHFKGLYDAGKQETLRKSISYAKEVFNRLFALQIISINPASGLNDLFPAKNGTSSKSMPSSNDENSLKLLLQGFDNYHGSLPIKMALKFMPYVFLRPKNIRHLTWQNIDWENKMLTYKEGDMKKDRAHKVPLSNQALEILRNMQEINGNRTYVFTTYTAKKDIPPVESTLSCAINRTKHPETGEPVGKGLMSPHGWRHTASTILNELKFDKDAIEAQLAHMDKDRIRAAYNKAEWMPERIKMMQAWADHLDAIKKATNLNCSSSDFI